MAGGTGGHVFPALALARLLRQQSLEVVWLGTTRGLEARVIPAEGIPIEHLSVGGLRGKGALTWLLAPFRLTLALGQALKIMRRHRPAVVVGLGGFVTGPGGVAAWLMRRPLVIHEQNAIAGLTNRLLAHLARVVLEAFPGSFSGEVHARVIGNPVRADVRPFIEDMSEAYGWADLVICRSGALTVSELAAAGVGAILVPFPAAVDDHQAFNAQYLVRAAAAVLIPDRELTEERLATELQRLCAGRGKLLAMAERARLLAKPHAADELAASCVELARRAA